MNILILYKSYHRMNTEKVAHAMAEAMNATLKKAGETRPEDLAGYDLIRLLIESGGWRRRVDRVLVIHCSPTTQEARVRARNRLDAALVQAIIAQQARRADRLDAADDVLVNEGPLEQR